MMNEMSQQNPAMQNQDVMEVLKLMGQIPFGYVIFNFLFYFLGGYLLYGALFAAVGSAVDSPAEAQQFMFPITIPMLISYFGLFTFILDDPTWSDKRLAIDHSIHIPDCHDGTYCLRGAGLATCAFNGFADSWLYVHNLGSRKNLPCRYSYAWHKDQLQGHGKMVYDESLMS